MRKNKVDIKSYLEEVKAAKTITSAPQPNKKRLIHSLQKEEKRNISENVSYSPYQKLNFDQRLSYHQPTNSPNYDNFQQFSQVYHQPNFSQYPPQSQNYYPGNERMKRMIVQQPSQVSYGRYQQPQQQYFGSYNSSNRHFCENLSQTREHRKSEQINELINRGLQIINEKVKIEENKNLQAKITRYFEEVKRIRIEPLQIHKKVKKIFEG